MRHLNWKNATTAMKYMDADRARAIEMARILTGASPGKSQPAGRRLLPPPKPKGVVVSGGESIYGSQKSVILPAKNLKRSFEFVSKPKVPSVSPALVEPVSAPKESLNVFDDDEDDFLVASLAHEEKRICVAAAEDAMADEDDDELLMEETARVEHTQVVEGAGIRGVKKQVTSTMKKVSGKDGLCVFFGKGAFDGANNITFNFGGK